MSAENIVWLIVGILGTPAVFLGMYLARKGKDIYEEIPKDL